MNAQEAIEIKEEVLAQMKLNLRGVIENPYGHLMDDKEELAKELEQEIEALSIVLESARLLHELLKSVRVEVPSGRATHLPDIEIDSQGYSNDFYILLSEKAYKSIGIR